MLSVIYSLVPSFLYPFIHLSINLFINSVGQSRAVSYSRIHPFIHPSVHPFVGRSVGRSGWLVGWFVRSFSFVRSIIQGFLPAILKVWLFFLTKSVFPNNLDITYLHITFTCPALVSSRADAPEISFTVYTGSSIQTRGAGALIIICRWKILLNRFKQSCNVWFCSFPEAKFRSCVLLRSTFKKKNHITSRHT